MLAAYGTSLRVEPENYDAIHFVSSLLADCTGEPIGYQFPRTNHEASLLTIQTLFGWISSSAEVIRALGSAGT